MTEEWFNHVEQQYDTQPCDRPGGGDPLERPHHQQINRLAHMRDDRDDFAAWMDGRMDFFGEILQETLNAMDAKLEEEKEYYAFLRSGS